MSFIRRRLGKFIGLTGAILSIPFVYMGGTATMGYLMPETCTVGAALTSYLANATCNGVVASLFTTLPEGAVTTAVQCVPYLHIDVINHLWCMAPIAALGGAALTTTAVGCVMNQAPAYGPVDSV